jgi:hypothetical protein
MNTFTYSPTKFSNEEVVEGLQTAVDGSFRAYIIGLRVIIALGYRC